MTIGEGLDRLTQIETLLEKFYASVRDKSRDEGLRLLTYYLARHCRRLGKALDEIGPEREQSLRGTEMVCDFNPETAELSALLNGRPETVTAAEVLRAAINYNAELLGLYGKILQQPISADARAFFQELIRMEEKDTILLKRMSATDYFG